MIRAALLSVALGIGLAADAGASEPEDVPVAPLAKAAADGVVAVRGDTPQSYQRVTLHLDNLSDATIDVDLAGAHLVPRRRGSSQRLGLGPLVDPRERRPGRGTILVRLGARERRELEVQTVCLDVRLPAPTDQAFSIGAEPMPKVRETVMRWWADHPDAPQGAVNAAIWQNRPAVYVPEGGSRSPRGRLAAAHAGSYYAIDDGELTMVDPDGVRRFLGTEIHRVIPTADGVYAVGIGRLGHPELWCLAITGSTPWAFLERLREPSSLVDVQRTPGGGLVLVTDRSVFVWRRESGLDEVPGIGTSDRLGLSHRRVDENRMAVVVAEPGRAEVRRDGETRHKAGTSTYVFLMVDLNTGRAVPVKTYWNVEAMAAGPAGIFALSPTGDLRRLAGSSLRDVASGEWTRIVAVGSRGLWVAHDRALRYLSTRGAVRAAPEIPCPEAVEVRIDAATDDLVWATDAGFHRVRADGSVETPVAPAGSER